MPYFCEKRDGTDRRGGWSTSMKNKKVNKLLSKSMTIMKQNGFSCRSQD